MNRILSIESGMRILRRHAEGESVKSIALRQNVSEQTVYSWLRYRGLSKEWLVKIKALEHRVNLAEGRHLRQANRTRIATSVIKRLQTSPKRRALLATAIRAEYRITQSVANIIVGISPNAGTSKSAVAADRVLLETMRKHMDLNPGRGFIGMFSNFLRDEPGTRYNALRLYAENLKAKASASERKKLYVPTPKKMSRAGQPNETWSIDFMQDVLSTGEKYWLVNAIDDFNREVLVLRAVKRRSAKVVAESLNLLVKGGRQPKSLRSDNGSEFKSKFYKDWADTLHIKRIYSRPYTPTDNSFIESFNRVVRTELFNRYSYKTFPELQRALDDWSVRYNFARPHTSLGMLSPLQFAHVCKQN